jgi:glycosyltransferase involved in cell wall biosynthesis
VNILSVASSLTHGGAESVLLDLVLGLTDDRHMVAHSTATRGLQPYQPFLADLRRARIPCADIPLEPLGAARCRQRAFGDFHPDVVLHHWWGRDSLRAWMRDTEGASSSRRPHFICILHHAGLPAPPGYDAYVLVAHQQRSSVAHLGNARVHVIPNGVDLRRFQPPAQRARPRTGPIVVGRISRLTPDKIAGDWIQAAAAFDLPDTRFVVAGSGAALPALRRDVASLHLQGRIDLPGHVARSRVPGLLASFDVFCHVTSTALECHSLALLEAQAAGVPVVAEARGGTPSIVRHGVNGLLASSPGEVGDLLRLLCTDPALRTRLSAGARQAARRFSRSRQLASYRRLLGDIARERTRRRPLDGDRQRLVEPVQRLVPGIARANQEPAVCPQAPPFGGVA